MKFTAHSKQAFLQGHTYGEFSPLAKEKCLKSGLCQIVRSGDLALPYPQLYWLPYSALGNLR